MGAVLVTGGVVMGISTNCIAGRHHREMQQAERDGNPGEAQVSMSFEDSTRKIGGGIATVLLLAGGASLASSMYFYTKGEEEGREYVC